MNARCLSSLILATLLASCEQKDVGNAPTANTPAALDMRLAEITKRLDEAEEKLRSVSTQVLLLKVKPFEETLFDPTAKTEYQRIDTNVGTFLISVQNVQPYLDGVKVTLDIGNVQSITYNGFSLTAKYGLRFPVFPDETNKSNDERQKDYTSYGEAVTAYNKSIKEVSAKMTDNLLPGAWNRVVVTLPNVKPTEFGSLKISLFGDVVSLRR